MADILNLSFGCGNTLLASQLNQIVDAINQLANQNEVQRGITLNTNTRELSITNNSSTADLDSILPYGIKDGGSWDDFITFYHDSNNNYEVDINGSGGRQCDLGVTGNIRTGLTNEYSYVRTDILLLKNGKNDSYIGKLYSSNGNLYYLYVDGSGQKTKYYPALLITRAKINLDGDTTGFELNVDIPQNQLLGSVSSIRIGGELDGNTLSYSNSYIAPTDGDNNPTIPQASDDNFGVIKLGYTLSGYDYPVELDNDGRAYVTVDWSNEGTTLVGLLGDNAIGSLSLPIYWSGNNGFQTCSIDTNGITAIDLPNNLHISLNNGTATIPAATNSDYGVVKLGYDNSSNSNRHPVASDNGSGLYVDLSNASVPSIGANDGVGEVLAIIQGANNTKQIGWAQLSPNGVAGVSSIEFGYSSGNALAFALAATSNQTLKLVPGDNILLSPDTDNYPNSIKISASLLFQDLSDVPTYDLNGYLKYENGNLVWAPGTSSNGGLTSGSWAKYFDEKTKGITPSSGLYLKWDSDGNLTQDSGSYTLNKATDSALGGIKIGYSESNSGSNTNRNYAVKLDTNNNKAYVNVPWTDSGARTYTSVSGGPTANQNLSFGGTFTVPYVSLDTNGQISVLNKTMTMPASQSSGSSNRTLENSTTRNNLKLALEQDGSICAMFDNVDSDSNVTSLNYARISELRYKAKRSLQSSFFFYKGTIDATNNIINPVFYVDLSYKIFLTKVTNTTNDYARINAFNSSNVSINTYSTWPSTAETVVKNLLLNKYGISLDFSTNATTGAYQIGTTNHLVLKTVNFYIEED